MTEELIERWTEPGFLAEAVGWVDERLAEAGRPRTGEVEQPHVRTWSTALRVPTEAGPVWFKANTPELRHEVAVVEAVSAPGAGPGAAAAGQRRRAWLDADVRRR